MHRAFQPSFSRRANRCIIEPLESRSLFSAPAIQSVSFNRALTQAIVYQFSTNVSASVNASTLVLYNLTERTTLQSNFIAFAYNSATNTATFTFPGFSHGRLPDGNYQAILYGQRVTDSTGTPMASDSNFDFTFYDGDITGDNTVNAADFAALAGNYGRTNATYTQGDLNYDGQVNAADFDILASRFNTTFAPAAPAPRAVDVTTFNASPDGSADHFDEAMFDALNTPDPNGRFFAMGSDAHRAEILAQGNSLAIYFNNLTVGINVNDPQAMIDTIQNDALGFTTTGVQPTWIVLNEISSSQWPSSATYRSWLETVVHTLHVDDGHEIILYAPFDHPGANAADWQTLAADAYIAPENYQSGAEIESLNFSLSAVQANYQLTKTSYAALGVPASRLFLGEDYSQTTAGTDYGRSGVSMDDWNEAIEVRSQAIHNVGFYGSISYDWGKDAMGVLEDEMIQYEQTYRAQILP